MELILQELSEKGGMRTKFETFHDCKFLHPTHVHNYTIPCWKLPFPLKFEGLSSDSNVAIGKLELIWVLDLFIAWYLFSFSGNF